MGTRMKVKEAATQMGVSEQFVRIGLQRGLLPFGKAVKTSSKWTYWISREQFDKWVSGEKAGDEKQD